MIRLAADMRVQVRENMRGGAGPVTFHHYFEQEEMKANVRLCTRLTLPPGTSIGPHEHAAEDEIFIVTKGTGILDDGSSKTPVASGDAILTGNGESHAISNSGSEDLEIIAIIIRYG